MSQVKSLYMEQTDTVRHKAVIMRTGMGEVNKKKYRWMQLNETIFHPKGGGQPSDEGTIAGIQVAYVHKIIQDKNRLDHYEILHCFEENQAFPFQEGDQVALCIDGEKRKLHSKLHTAGHLVAEAVKKNYPDLEGYQGNHYPNESFVRFKMLAPSVAYSKEEIKKKVEAEILLWIQEDLPVHVQMSPSGLRLVKMTQDWTPCGGTHLNSLRDLGPVEITDVTFNQKEGTATVKYRMT
ncbi:MAG: hypothetical protein LLG04_11365 [Parachlamydia sp.]|nr:hypothetical protein [Parachlamydia sp.]